MLVCGTKFPSISFHRGRICDLRWCWRSARGQQMVIVPSRQKKKKKKRKSKQSNFDQDNSMKRCEEINNQIGYITRLSSRNNRGSIVNGFSVSVQKNVAAYKYMHVQRWNRHCRDLYSLINAAENGTREGAREQSGREISFPLQENPNEAVSILNDLVQLRLRWFEHANRKQFSSLEIFSKKTTLASSGTSRLLV